MAIGRATMLVRAAVLGAIARVDARRAGPAHEPDDHVRCARELKGASDDEEPSDLDQPQQPGRASAAAPWARGVAGIEWAGAASSWPDNGALPCDGGQGSPPGG